MFNVTILIPMSVLSLKMARNARRIQDLLVLIWLFLVVRCHRSDSYTSPQPHQRHDVSQKSKADIDAQQQQQHSMENTVITSRKTFFRHTISAVSLLGGSTIGLLKADLVSAAVDTVGKDPNCNEASCLGVWDGLLANCDHSSSRRSAGCVSSQDDTPGTFAEPWDYSDDTTISLTTVSSDDNTVAQIMERIIQAIQTISNRRGDTVEIVFQQERYLHVVFTDRNSGETSDGEFYITPSDTTIQFRLSTTQNNSTGGSTSSTTTTNQSGVNDRRRFTTSLFKSSSLRNMERAELIRTELQWLKLPILRNRQRALFFVESDFDTFGPQSAALGPPEEMRIKDINGN